MEVVVEITHRWDPSRLYRTQYLVGQGCMTDCLNKSMYVYGLQAIDWSAGLNHSCVACCAIRRIVWCEQTPDRSCSNSKHARTSALILACRSFGQFVHTVLLRYVTWPTTSKAGWCCAWEPFAIPLEIPIPSLNTVHQFNSITRDRQLHVRAEVSSE